ncbi:MAG: DUF2306 domain-containing protein [Gemmatimonadetes bacterium]|nr:DUF2306 domain-containing protein [Gemmatimonadota bacterium]
MSEAGLVHTTAAVAALMAGGAVVLGRKGTRLHRQLGHLYVWAMVVVNGTSFLLTGLTGRFGPFHVFALISLATLCAGAVPALTRWPRETWLEYHARFMAWSYAGLVAAAGAEAAVRVPGVPFAAAVVLVTGVVTVASGVLIHGGGEAMLRRAMSRARRGPIGVLVLAAMIPAGGGVAAQEAAWPDSGSGVEALIGDLDRAVTEGSLAGVRAVRLRLDSLAADGDALRLHYLGYALYREAELLPGSRAEERRELRRLARAALERSGERLVMAETHALIAMLIGIEIGERPLKGILLGRRWSAELARAREAGPANPRVLLLAGIAAYHAPEGHGGGLARAEADLVAAVAAFAGDTARPPLPAWGHAEAYAWLGHLRERQGRGAEARTAYRRALELAPDYAWARERLDRLSPESAAPSRERSLRPRRAAAGRP